MGLFPGSYQIAVSSTEALSEAEDAEVCWLVPRRHGNFRTSGLETIVQGPNDSMIVELTWQGAAVTNTETNTKTNIETNTDPDAERSSILEEDRETREQQNDDA